MKKIVFFTFLFSFLLILLTFLNYKIDIFLTNFFLGPVSVGVYIIAVGISEILWILSHSASTVIFPRLAKLSCSDPEYKFLTNSLSRIVIALTLFFSVFIFLIIDFIINIFFVIIILLCWWLVSLKILHSSMKLSQLSWHATSRMEEAWELRVEP